MRLKSLVKTLLLLLAAGLVRAGTNDFHWQPITLPATAVASRFADLDNDKRLDLVAVSPTQLFVYRQRAFGFTNAPDNTVELPPLTAWIAPFDVDSHPGLELLVSTASGLVYYRQARGSFETEPHQLIKADQVFAGGESPQLLSLNASNAIPVLSATQATFYHRNEAFEWSAAQPLALDERETTWFEERNQWTVGPNSSRSIRIQQTLQANPDASSEAHFENDRVKALVEELKKAGPNRDLGTNRLDLNGDGREDLIIWQTVWGMNLSMNLKTHLHLFLRAADGQLPKQETRVLRYAGGPIPVGSTQSPPSPIVDLNGDGSYELVLLEFRSTLTSAGGVVDLVLSGGLECALTVRSFNRGMFSGGSSNSIPFRTIMPVTTIVPLEEFDHWPFFLHGDFNGDGRPDLMVKRSSTQWNILFSTSDGRWFAPQPALTFETPMQGYFEISDLNGDGLSDMVARAQDEPRIFVSFTPTQPGKGKRP